MSKRRFLCRAVLCAAAASWGAWVSGGVAAQEEDRQSTGERLSMGEMVRITGATVLRGGPASPPVLYPVALEGNVVGMKGDTLLFETGAEPVYWIPLGPRPLVERRATVTDTKRVLFVTTGVAGLGGATIAWGLKQDCNPDDIAIALGLAGNDCAEAESGGAVALRGFAIGVGVGAVVGLALRRFAKRQAWVPVRLDGLRFVSPGGANPGSMAVALRLPLGSLGR